MINGRIKKLLSKLGMKESTSRFTDAKLPPTFHEGSKQINAVWTSPIVMPIAASIAPFWFGVGDYRAFIIDFPINVILGKEFILICKL